VFGHHFEQNQKFPVLNLFPYGNLKLFFQQWQQFLKPQNPEEIAMKSTLHTAKALSTMLCLSALAACGGGGEQSQSNSTALLSSVTVGSAVTAATATTAGATTTAVTTVSTPTVTAASIATAGSAITDVRFENTNTQSNQANVPVTFGQVFVVGALSPADGVVGQLDDGSTVPLQVDVKALHPDGSVRHAIISAVLPSLGAAQVSKMSLVKSGAAAAATTALATSDMMRYGFSASVHATINGVRYDAFADDLIKKAPHKTWLSGPVVNEWQVSAPMKTSSGSVHPHLSARFAIRWYQGIQKARVDVTVENDWAYEPSPQNITYDARVLVGAQEVYAKTGLTHYHHARWRKTFWWNGAAPEVNVKHNTAYLIASRALPNYDQSVVVPETTLAAMKTKWTAAMTEPMSIGVASAYMPQTGGRGDIGILPDWASIWLLTMDKRARDVTLGTADGAGSWSSHYRDRNTDKPVSLADFPYMTIAGHAGDTYNPVTKKQELFPACATGACSNPNTHDPDHQPNLAYLPYMLTGDYYYLEELQFWAMWDAFYTNPGYRQNVKGLFYSEQVRGQAWSMRTLAEAAYITPDDDRLKAHFTSIVNNNLDWYNATYTNNAQANKLNVIVNGYSLVYNNATGLAPWQDDFFTSAIGHANELGFTNAAPLLAWKAKFPVDRMTAPGACWIDGSIYALNVRASSTAPYYTTMAEAYNASHTSLFTTLACGSSAMATALKLKVGEMTGYSDTMIGYPSNMQPALAYAADALGAPGKSAWTLFMNRSVKPNYGLGPQFAIVPR
jgi:hypothetical protein